VARVVELARVVGLQVLGSLNWESRLLDQEGLLVASSSD
jgi:hypothetical protein